MTTSRTTHDHGPIDTTVTSSTTRCATDHTGDQDTQNRRFNSRHRILQLTKSVQHLNIEPYSDKLMLLLCRIFYTAIHRPTDDLRLGYRVAPRWCPLVFEGMDRLGNKTIQVLAGLEQMVCQLLRRHGYRLQWTARKPGPLPLPNHKWLDWFDPIDRLVIDNVRERDRALIRYTKGRVSPARLIAQIAAAWPELRIMVWVTRIDESKQLARELRKFFPDVTALYSGNFPSRRSRIVVATYKQLYVAQVEIEKRDIAIVLNAAEVVRSKIGRGMLPGAQRARFYGLLPDHERLAPYDQDWVTALFGPNPVWVPAHGRERRPVDVLLTKITGGPRLASDADIYVLKRQGIWHHPVRNRRIADLATALQEQDEQRIGHYLPALAACTSLHGCWGRIAIMVSTVEHAFALVKLLPTWPVVVDKDVQIAGLTGDRRRRLVEGGHPKLRTRANVIVTQAGLKRAGEIDVLIRADGGTGLPTLPHKIATVPTTKQPPHLLLIDMTDKHHPELRKHTRCRRDAYAAARWNLVGTQRQTDLDHFIATRPKVEFS